jgi:ABC-type sugar transport system substrate-binding protein
MLILPTTDGEDLTIFRDVLQDPEGAAEGEYIYREGIVRQGMPSAQQAEVIREAMDKGVSALVVVAADPDAVAPALAEAREQGKPVVVVGREVPADGPPFPAVAFPPSEEAARRIMATLTRDAGWGEAPDGPRAVILTDASKGWRTQPLIEALRAAADEVGVPVAKVIPFQKTVEAARDTLVAALRDDPSIELVLFEDRVGAEAAARVAKDPDLGPDRRLRIGGFVADLDPRLRDALGDEAIVADRQVDEAAKQAIRMILRLLEGGDVPESVVIEPVFRGELPGGLGTGAPTTP